MGRSSTLHCHDCEYEVVTSAGPDMGFNVSTKTYVCLSCKNLVDIVISERAKELVNVSPTENLSCPDCSGDKLVVWDHVNRPCPHCNSKLDYKRRNSTVVFWD